MAQIHLAQSVPKTLWITELTASGSWCARQMKTVRSLLADDGIEYAELEKRIRAGDLQRVRHGVVDVPRDLSYEAAHRRLVAATLLGLGDGFVLSHQTAAALHGLPVAAADLSLVHLTRPGISGGRRSPTLHVRRAELPEEDVTTTREGWPVTTPERTAWDLARSLSFADAVAVLDGALRVGVDRTALLTRCDEGRHRRGKVQARAAISFADSRSESRGESHSRVLMDRLGLPEPELQYVVADADARADFAWREYRLLGEFDGLAKYGAQFTGGDPIVAFRREKEREQRLRALGWWIIRWGWPQLANPREFERLLRGAMRTR